MDKIVILSLVCVVVSQVCAMELVDVNQQAQSKQVGIYSDNNKRKYYHDRYYHGIIDEGHLYAVYDGHFGAEVAEFLKQNLPEYFKKTSGSMRERMIETFKNIDNDEIVIKHKRCGATAAVVFVKDNKAHFAHVGDVRAVLEKNGKVAFTTIDHTPDRADEYIRIEDLKQAEFIEQMKKNRITSRSFGDHGYNKEVMVAEPDYNEMVLTQQHKFLMLATDGLWSVMSNEEAVNILKEQQAKAENIDDLAKVLASFAIRRGSKDNITVMLIDLLS